jgi:ECF transporter S component (folate family)
MKKTKQIPLLTMVTCGMIIALDVVLTRFASVNLWDRRIGFSFVAIAVAAYLYGPLAAALTHGISDALGAILFPTGAYFPGFTLTAALIGVIYGLSFCRSAKWWRSAVGVIAAQLLCSVGLNTLWISITNHAPYLAILPGRLIQAAVMTPVQLVVVPLVLVALERSGVCRLLKLGT